MKSVRDIFIIGTPKHYGFDVTAVKSVTVQVWSPVFENFRPLWVLSDRLGEIRK